MIMFEHLDEKFDVAPTLDTPTEKLEKVVAEDDAAHARETLRNLIDKGNEAIEGILHIAKNSDHPRAYEVAGQLIKTVSDTAKDLLEVQKRKKDLEKDEKPKIQTQNNLFVGSTHELLKAMKLAQEPLKIADIEHHGN
jgi:hypothetical protein